MERLGEKTGCFHVARLRTITIDFQRFFWSVGKSVQHDCDMLSTWAGERTHIGHLLPPQDEKECQRMAEAQKAMFG
jgi:hypothetical protein